MLLYTYYIAGGMVRSAHHIILSYDVISYRRWKDSLGSWYGKGIVSSFNAKLRASQTRLRTHPNPNPEHPRPVIVAYKLCLTLQLRLVLLNDRILVCFPRVPSLRTAQSDMQRTRSGSDRAVFLCNSCVPAPAVLQRKTTKVAPTQ